MKKLLVFLLIFQFNSVFGQKTLEQIISEISQDEYYYSPSGYYDEAGEKQGISIQNEAQILNRLKLEPSRQSEYFITGKYEIYHSILLFVSKYSLSEDVHSAILLDKSLNIIDRLDETAYDNAEGFYGVTTSIDLNIITTRSYNEFDTPKSITKKYTITDGGFKVVKDQVVVKEPSGILVREDPTIASTIIGSAHDLDTFNFLGYSYRLDSVFDDGTFLKGQWLEIGENDIFAHLGFVFGAYVKRRMCLVTNEYNVILDEISKEDFLVEESKSASAPSIEKITDIDEIKKILKGQIKGEMNEYGEFFIKKIRADNGKEIVEYWDDFGISAYYPTYHYLLLDGGHSSEFLIDMKNGDDDIARIGNPEYYLPSPKNTFRLNGFYSGQSFVHFLERTIENSAPEYLFSMSSILALDFIEKYFWKDDTTILMKVEEDYYSIQLQKRN